MKLETPRHEAEIEKSHQINIFFHSFWEPLFQSKNKWNFWLGLSFLDIQSSKELAIVKVNFLTKCGSR